MSALQVQLIHNNSSISSDAGNFEVVTQQSAGKAVAIHATVTNQARATRACRLTSRTQAPKPGSRFLKDDGTWAEVTSEQSLWSQNGDDITYTKGNVGIAETPNNRLKVVDGNVSVSHRAQGTSAWARVRANAAPAYLRLED